MIVSSYHFLLAPLVAVAALGLLVLICRWVFSTEDRDARAARRLEKAAAARDYGLLVPLTAVRTAEDAAMLREVLRDAGIRSSLSNEGEVLVFSKDLTRARGLVSAG
ncbi:MAG: hypothetical protein ACXVGH_05675 [Mycobacteriales bacterium]